MPGILKNQRLHTLTIVSLIKRIWHYSDDIHTGTFVLVHVTIGYHVTWPIGAARNVITGTGS